MVKNLPAVQEKQIWSLGREDSPGVGNGSPLQYSCLDSPHGQRSLMSYSPRVAKSQTQPGDWTHTHEEGGAGGITAVPTPFSAHQGSKDVVGYASNGRSHSFLSGGFLGIWNFLEKSLLTIWYHNVEFVVLLPWGSWHSWVSPLLRTVLLLLIILRLILFSL